MVEGQACAEEENPHTADQGGDVAQVAVAVAERETEREKDFHLIGAICI